MAKYLNKSKRQKDQTCKDTQNKYNNTEQTINLQASHQVHQGIQHQMQL